MKHSLFTNLHDKCGSCPQKSVTSYMEVYIELDYDVIFYLVIILFVMALILPFFIKNYINTKYFIKNVNNYTLIELIWIIIPSLILILIVSPLFKLSYLMDELTDPSLSMFAEGQEWYGSSRYENIFDTLDLDPNLIPEYDLEEGALGKMRDNMVTLLGNIDTTFIGFLENIIYEYIYDSHFLQNQYDFYIETEPIEYDITNFLSGNANHGRPWEVGNENVNHGRPWEVGGQTPTNQAPIEPSPRIINIRCVAVTLKTTLADWNDCFIFADGFDVKTISSGRGRMGFGLLSKFNCLGYSSMSSLNESPIMAEENISIHEGLFKVLKVQTDNETGNRTHIFRINPEKLRELGNVEFRTQGLPALQPNGVFMALVVERFQ